MGVVQLMFGPLGPECWVIHVLLAPLEYDHYLTLCQMRMLDMLHGH